MTYNNQTRAHPSVTTLAAHLDRRLSAEEARAVREHIIECDVCREIVTESAVAVEEELSEEPTNVRAFPKRWIAAAIAAAVLVPLLALSLFLTRGGDGAADLARLAALAPEERRTETRLSIDVWAPLAAVTRGGDDRQGNAELLETAAELDRRAEESPSARTLHALGVAQMMLGDTAHAEETFADALVHAGGDDEQLLVDHAAALIQNGITSGDRDRLERAIAIIRGELSQPPSPAAQFNLALALEAIGDRAGAIEAWQTYLSQDATSEWAAEAREHLDRR